MDMVSGIVTSRGFRLLLESVVVVSLFLHTSRTKMWRMQRENLRLDSSHLLDQVVQFSCSEGV